MIITKNVKLISLILVVAICLGITGVSAEVEEVSAEVEEVSAEVEEVSAEVEKVLVEDYSNKVQAFTPVDLTGVVNRGFADDVAGDGKGGWSDQGASNDMACFKARGRVKFDGVEYDIIEPNKNDGKSAIILRGQRDKSVPLEVEIEVNKKFKGAYFLHAAPWLAGDEQVGEYVFNYEDGTQKTTRIFGGKEVFNWWYGGKSDYAKVAWSGNNALSDVALATFPIKNPYPDKMVKSITARTVGICPYLALVAITLTDAGPYLPYEKIINIGNPDTSDWFAFSPPNDPEIVEGTAMDVSFLQDAPAGKHGKIKIDGENMYFEDGTQAKFWGVNITSWNIFPSNEEARDSAKRIAQLGFNAVRFHIFESSAYSDKGTSTQPTTTTRRRNMLSVDDMNKFCYFVNELKKRGIYYCVDIESGGDPLMDENDQDIGNYASLSRGPVYFDKDMTDRQKRYTEQFFSYYNPYTKTKIGEDPAFIMAAIYNEASFFMVPDFNWDYYYPILKEMYNDWLKERYPTRSALEKAWTKEGDIGIGLLETENQFDGTVDVFSESGRRKINAPRFEDNLRFINYVQSGHYKDRIKQIRELGGDLMVEGSTFYCSGSADTANMYSLATSADCFSVQCYLFLAIGNGENVAPGTTIGVPKPMLKNNTYPMGVFANRRIFGMPQLITEWDAGALNPYASEMWLAMPAATALQNWNPFMFMFNNQSIVKSKNENKDSIIHSTHPLAERPSQNVFPAMSMMVRRGDVTEAQAGYIKSRFQNEEAFQKGNQTITSDGSMVYVGKTYTAFDDFCYDSKFNNNDVLKVAEYGKKTGKYASITDEILWDENSGILRVNTDRSQAIAGYIGTEAIDLNDSKFEITTKFATAFLTSLSNDSIAETDRMLLSLQGDYRNNKLVMTEDGSTVVEAGEGPVLEEPVEGKITLKSYDDFEIYSLDRYGRRDKKLYVTKTENGFSQVEISKEYRTNNYEIIRVKKSEKVAKNEKIIFLTEEMTADCFDDLDGYEQYKEKIERIYLQGYMMPTGNRTFSPSRTVTRGQFITLLSEVLGFAEDAENKTSFNDVSEDSTNYKRIVAAEKMGIINGDENGNFNPNETISKQDMLIITKKALSNTMKTRNEARSNKVASNNSVSAYAKEAVDYMIKYGYVSNNENFLSAASRAEVCSLIYSILWE